MADLSQQKKYLPETAGELMVSREQIPVVTTNTTVSQVRELLIEKTPKLTSIDYIYVVDKDNRLRGVFSIKELFQQQKENEN